MLFVLHQLLCAKSRPTRAQGGPGELDAVEGLPLLPHSRPGQARSLRRHCVRTLRISAAYRCAWLACVCFSVGRLFVYACLHVCRHASVLARMQTCVHASKRACTRAAVRAARVPRCRPAPPPPPTTQTTPQPHASATNRNAQLSSGRSGFVVASERHADTHWPTFVAFPHEKLPTRALTSHQSDTVAARWRA